RSSFAKETDHDSAWTNAARFDPDGFDRGLVGGRAGIAARADVGSSAAGGAGGGGACSERRQERRAQGRSRESAAGLSKAARGSSQAAAADGRETPRIRREVDQGLRREAARSAKANARSDAKSGRRRLPGVRPPRRLPGRRLSRGGSPSGRHSSRRRL